MKLALYVISRFASAITDNSREVLLHFISNLHAVDSGNGVIRFLHVHVYGGCIYMYIHVDGPDSVYARYMEHTCTCIYICICIHAIYFTAIGFPHSFLLSFEVEATFI